MLKKVGLDGAAARDRIALGHQRKREVARQEFESKRQQAATRDAASAVGRITDKFSAYDSKKEEQFKQQTVGLVTYDEFKKTREEIERNDAAARAAAEQEAQSAAAMAKKKRSARQMASLSFAGDDSDGDSDDDDDDDDDDNDDAQPAVRRKVMKNPEADTRFLPDRERDQEEERERKRLRLEWEEQQERIKKEVFQIQFSYFDGKSQRRSLELTKGTTIRQFLELAKKEFKEIKLVMADALMFIKEDLIIPHDLTFYELFVTKARGKSGPLFQFNVTEDIRLVNDTNVETEESHPGKVIERRWYERNKKTFPASRWEVFDPTKSYGERYTIKS